MESRNMILPFVDKDGKECNKNDSFVSITKMSEGYELKTNLVCGEESSFTTKTLGCHEYCPSGNGKCTCNCNFICRCLITHYCFYTCT